MIGEPESSELALLRADYPGWEMWRNSDGVYIAWHVGTQPPVLVRSLTVSGLRSAVVSSAAE